MLDSQKLSDNWGWSAPQTQAFSPSTPTSTTGKTSITKTPTTATTGGATGGTMASNASFQYPGQWNQANDIWSQMAGGLGTSMDWLKNLLAGGGNPVDVSGWADAYRPAMMDDYADAVKQMAEQAGVGGTRYGSGLQQALANYGGKLQNQFNEQMADKWLGAQESALSRAMSGAGTLGSMGATAGEGLMGLGSQYANLPLSVAQMMSGLGSQLTSQQIDPWTQMLAGLMGNTQAGAQTYTPSALQSLLMSLSSTLPSAFSGGAGNTVASGGWAGSK